MRGGAVSGCMLVAFGMLGCGEEAGTAGAPVRIAYITHAECNPFCDLCRAGARQAQEDLTIRNERPVDVRIMEPKCPDATGMDAADEDTSDPCVFARPQMAVLREAIDTKVDAMAVDVFDPACETSLIDEAVDAGIKVITYGGDAPNSKRHAYYGMDNRAAAAFLVDALATINGHTGKIAFQTRFEDDAGGGYVISPAVTFIERVAGFTEALAKYPDMTNVATLPCVGYDNDDPFCARQAEEALEETPDIAGFFFSLSKILRESNLAEHAPLLTARAKERTIHSVAFDALPEYFEPMRAGYVDVLLGQKLYGWGFDTVLLAHDMVTLNRPVDPFVNAGWYTVCPNNLDEFKQKYEDQDYRTPLSKCSLLP